MRGYTKLFLKAKKYGRSLLQRTQLKSNILPGAFVRPIDYN